MIVLENDDLRLAMATSPIFKDAVSDLDAIDMAYAGPIDFGALTEADRKEIHEWLERGGPPPSAIQAYREKVIIQGKVR